MFDLRSAGMCCVEDRRSASLSGWNRLSTVLVVGVRVLFLLIGGWNSKSGELWKGLRRL